MQATETGSKQYNGKKQVVSHKVAGIKDGSKTVLSKYGLDRQIIMDQLEFHVRAQTARC